MCIDIGIFLILLILLLNEWRTQWFQQATQTDPFPSLSEFTASEQAIIYLLLTFGTLLLMLILTKSLIIPIGLISIILAFILNFFILITLNKVLSFMRQHKRLFISFITFPYLWLMIGSIIVVELSFLNWIKEVETYFWHPFAYFTIVYLLLLFLVAVAMTLKTSEDCFFIEQNFSKETKSNKISGHKTYFAQIKAISKYWNRLNRDFLLIAILDSVIVVLLTSIMLHLTLLLVIYLFKLTS